MCVCERQYLSQGGKVQYSAGLRHVHMHVHVHAVGGDRNVASCRGRHGTHVSVQVVTVRFVPCSPLPCACFSYLTVEVLLVIIIHSTARSRTGATINTRDTTVRKGERIERLTA